MKYAATVLCIIFALTLTATSQAKVSQASLPTCNKVYSQAQHAKYARSVYNRDKLTKRALDRIEDMRVCQHTGKARVNARRLTRRLRNRYKKRKIVGISSGWAIPEYIVMCESHGNFKAVNNSNPARPAGAYQIITSTWLAHGGGKFAPTADAATPRQQHIVAARIWASGGSSQWECS